MTGTEQLTASLTKVELADGTVLLRPPTLADVPAVTAACQDPDIARWTIVPSPYAISDAVFFVEQVSDQGWGPKRAGFTASCDPATTTLPPRQEPIDPKSGTLRPDLDAIALLLWAT